jgi:uncharacterized protein YkwD
LAAHNQLRQGYNNYVQVVWNDTLAAEAQAYASFLISEYASTASTDPSATCISNFLNYGSDENSDGGENLFATFGAYQTPSYILERWGGQEITLNPVISNATTRIGCGVASHNLCDYHVCRYL